MNIGKNIKKYRKEKGMTQKELAEKINKSTITIRKYEANDTTPPIDVLGQIATILQVPIDILIGSTLTPVPKDGGISHMVDSQFGVFDPNLESYTDFLERKLGASQEYQKDNLFTSSIIPSFSSELVTAINRAISEKENKLHSINEIKQLIFDRAKINSIWHLDDEKELPLIEIVKLLDFFKKNYSDDFYNFIVGYSFGFSDLDESIKGIIHVYREVATKKISVPSGLAIKPRIIDLDLAYQSIVNLLFYVNNGEDLPNITEPEFESLLKKVCDLLEFELYKLKKEGENSGE